MIKRTWFFFLAILLFMLPACVTVEATEPTITPVNPDLEEELAEHSIATAYAKKTQIASRVSPYVKLSDGEQRYLAFWFTWNDETVLLPLGEFIAPDSGLVICRLEPGVRIVSGNLYTGLTLVDNKCVVDEKAAENAPALIKIPRYFENGIETQGLNIIDLNGGYAENLADIVTIIVKNDLLGSGNLTLSIHRTDGPKGEPYSDVSMVPTYTLPVEALQVPFPTDQLGNFEYAEDVVYALEREFTWEIPEGYSDLNLSPGDENWFVLNINEKGREPDVAYIQVKGVGTSANP